MPPSGPRTAQLDDGWNSGVKIKVGTSNVVRGALNQDLKKSAPENKTVAAPEGLIVTGCKDQIVGPIIRGTYVLHSNNHGKPVYRNYEQFEVKCLSIMLYYWDSRDGTEFSGWWFGPEVGGERTWAHNPKADADRPPPTGWKCPFDGDVDETLVVGSSSAKEVQGPAKPIPKGEDEIEVVGPERVPVSQVVFRGNRWVKKPMTVGEPANNQKEQREAAAMIGSPTELKEKILRLKMEQEEQKRRQREAVSKVRAAIDKMNKATPVTFHALQDELLKVFASVEADLGPEEVELRRDCNRAVANGRKEAESMLEERRETAWRFLANFDAITESIECNDDLEDIEGQLKRLNDFGLQLFRSRTKEENNTLHPALASIPAVLDAVRKTLSAHKYVLDYEATLAASDLARQGEQADIDNRPAETVRAAYHHAKFYYDEQRKNLQKYDANGDGFLTKVEVGLFVGEEYGLQLPDSALEKIFNTLTQKPLSVVYKEIDANPHVDPSDFYPGVPLDAGQNLKMLIGAHRELSREYERRKKMEDLQFEWQRSLEEAGMLLDLLEPRVTAAQAETERLQALIGEIRAAEILKGIGKASEETAQLDKDLTDCYAKINPTLSSSKADDLQRSFFLKSEDAKNLRLRAGRLTAAVKRAAVAHGTIKKQVAARSKLDTHLVYTQIANLLDAHKEDTELLFSSVDSEGSDRTLPQDEVMSFLRLRWDVLSEFPEAEVIAWFNLRAAKTPGAGMSQEQLTRPKRVRYKVEKAVAMTKGLSIKESSCVRRLNAGEFVELMDSPKSDEEFDVVRIRIRAVRDNAVGWVTIRGNQGQNYIEPCEGE